MTCPLRHMSLWNGTYNAPWLASATLMMILIWKHMSRMRRFCGLFLITSCFSFSWWRWGKRALCSVQRDDAHDYAWLMTTSLHGNAFRITGPLWWNTQWFASDSLSQMASNADRTWFYLLLPWTSYSTSNYLFMMTSSNGKKSALLAICAGN